MNDIPFVVTTRVNSYQLPRRRIEPILGYNIFRVIGTRQQMVETRGFYRRPFLMFHSAQNLHHRFRGPHDALLATLHAEVWEGIPASEVPEGEQQSMITLFSQHNMLQLIVADAEGSLVGHEAWREQYNARCLEIASELGKPVNEIKKTILALTLLAAGSDGSEAIATLEEAKIFDLARLGEVEAIGARLNWRSAVLTATIVRQQELMLQAGRSIEALWQHHNDPHAQREWLPDEAQEISNLLLGAKDRPYRSWARRNREDLAAYQLAIRRKEPILANGAAQRLHVSSQCFGFSRDVHVLLYRIALGKPRRGKPRQELNNKVHEGLLGLHRKIEPWGADVLHNNPLWRVKGNLGDALDLVQSPHCDWREVNQILHDIAGALGD